MHHRILITLMVVLGLPLLGLAQTAEVRGTVVDPGNNPLVGATIYAPQLKLGAYSNDQGIFSIPRVPEGTHEFLATYFGFDTTFITVEVTPTDKTKTVKFTLAEKTVFTNQVEIVGRKTGEIDKKRVTTGVTAIDPEEIKILPSVGTADLAQFLQVLPGVVFTGEQGGQLYIRGGTPIQNMVRLDGMVIYSPFHSIGLFSVFDPDYIRSVDVYSAAFPAEFGGRVSSIVDIKSRHGNLQKFGLKLNLNPFSADALIEGPITSSENGSGISYLVSVRNNFIDQTSPSLYGYVNDTLGLPYNFLDIYGKLTFTDGINFVNLFGFNHQDNVNYQFPADIGWRSSGGGGNFQVLPNDSKIILNGYLAFSSYQTELESQSETFPRESGISGFNGGLEISSIINSVDNFRFGLTLLGFTTNYTFTNSLGFQTIDENSNTELSIYSTYKHVFLGKQTNDYGQRREIAVLEPGVRIHYYNNQGVSFEPRVRAKLNLPRVSISGGLGYYTQNILAGVSDRDVVNFFQAFLTAPPSIQGQSGNNTLQRSWHLLGGIEFELIKNLTTNVEGWMKDFTQLVGINREKLFPTDPNFIRETGLAYGFDIILKYQNRGMYFYANYGWAKSTRTDTRQTYPPVFDRRHTVNVVGAYRLGTFPLRPDEEGRPRLRPKFTDSKWEFSARWTLGSGFPFTQTQGYFEKVNFQQQGAQTNIANQNGNLGLILAQQLNGGRLPYYHRLDLSAKRRFIFANKFLLELALSVINTYNRDNIFYFDRVRFEEVYQLPVLPTLGVTLRY